MLKKVVQQGRREPRGEGYVESLGEARTKLANFFSFLPVLDEQQAG
jgi:hypothetical protein